MKKILFFALATFILACKKEKDPKTELLYGTWKGSAWIIAGKSDNNANNINFDFKADGTYSAGLGGQTEKGTFRLQDGKLYTIAENKIEKMVALAKLTKDSIVMDMNRQGQAEQLFLIKK
jgi:Lipocalin-like domain